MSSPTSPNYSVLFCSMGINFDLSRSDVENLLAGFLAGAQGAELGARLLDVGNLPAACREQVRLAQASGRAWTAWLTPCGPIAAWGDYDIQGSRKINAYLLFVEWYCLSSGHHSLWCYCCPERPTEWIVGRGRHSEAR
jgi:hypothetical protein